MSLGDYLNGLQSGSSGRSSVSLNSLLSEYLQEMQQLADGTLLPKGASEIQLPAGRVSLSSLYCLRLSARVVCIRKVCSREGAPFVSLYLQNYPRRTSIARRQPYRAGAGA